MIGNPRSDFDHQMTTFILDMKDLPPAYDEKVRILITNPDTILRFLDKGTERDHFCINKKNEYISLRLPKKGDPTSESVWCRLPNWDIPLAIPCLVVDKDCQELIIHATRKSRIFRYPMGSSEEIVARDNKKIPLLPIRELASGFREDPPPKAPEVPSPDKTASPTTGEPKDFLSSWDEKADLRASLTMMKQQLALLEEAINRPPTYTSYHPEWYRDRNRPPVGSPQWEEFRARDLADPIPFIKAFHARYDY